MQVLRFMRPFFFGRRRAPVHLHYTLMSSFTCTTLACAPCPTLLYAWLARVLEAALGRRTFILSIQEPLLPECDEYDDLWDSGREWRAHGIAIRYHLIVIFRMLPWLLLTRVLRRSGPRAA